MLDLTPDRTGLIPPAYAQRYKELGDFIRSCYENPMKPIDYIVSKNSLVHTLKFNGAPATVDRSVIREDQTNGQVIRGYIIEAQLNNATTSDQWITVAQGTSIGNKKIDLWKSGPLLVNAVRFNVTVTLDAPVVRSFDVFLCSQS